MNKRSSVLYVVFCLLATALVLPAGTAEAHWCNNIWAAPSRIVVKPEVTTLQVSAGKPAKLRVYVQNNLPYKLFSLQMRGNAGGYSISVSPGQQDINPGQNVSFTFTVSGAGGSVPVSSLSLQMQFRPGGYPNGWLDSSSNCMLNPNVSKAALAQGATQWWSYNSTCKVNNQSPSLNAAALFDVDPKATLTSGAPFLGRTGIQQLIKWFGYRFCWTSSGTWRCGGQDCPGACAEGSAWSSTQQFPQDTMRAGVELAARKAKLGSELTAARAGATNALKGGCSLGTKPNQHKCLAAVVGAHLWAGAGNTAAFQAALKDGGNCVPQGCQDAGMRILTGAPKLTCGGGAYEEEAACAAAEGLRGDDAPVKSILLAKAGDGYQPSGGDYRSLYYSYMLRIVSEARRAQAGKVSYYPDAGKPFTAADGPPAKKDTGKPKVDKAPTKKDGKQPPKGDGPVASKDGPVVKGDSATQEAGESDGCSVAENSRGESGLLLLGLLLGLMLRRRGKQ